VLAARAFVSAPIISRSIWKDENQHHSCAALRTGWTSDHHWRINSLCSHFLSPTRFARARNRLSFWISLKLHLGWFGCY
jgi:hypothetical protein